MITIIKNIPNTSGEKLPDGRSWLDLYSDYKRVPGLCPVCSRNAVEVGAHVTRISKGGTYIAPLCKVCNHHSNTSPMCIDASYLLQLAD